MEYREYSYGINNAAFQHTNQGFGHAHQRKGNSKLKFSYSFVKTFKTTIEFVDNFHFSRNVLDFLQCTEPQMELVTTSIIHLGDRPSCHSFGFCLQTTVMVLNSLGGRSAMVLCLIPELSAPWFTG